jgi:hypothetical protein
MSDTALLGTLCVLVVVNAMLVVLAYISAVHESKNHFERTLEWMRSRFWLYVMSDGVTTRSIALAGALGSLWSVIWFQCLGPLAIAPGIALAALIIQRPFKAVLSAFRALKTSSLEGHSRADGREVLSLDR